jgi:toxin ParE1/3/4
MLSESLRDTPDLSFSPLATTDIKQTWDYLSERGYEVAENFIRSIIEICGTIAQNPLIGRDRSDLIVRLRQFPYKNYNIFYFQIENGVEIFRILHSSRDQVQVFKDAIDDNN